MIVFILFTINIFVSFWLFRVVYRRDLPLANNVFNPMNIINGLHIFISFDYVNIALSSEVVFAGKQFLVNTTDIEHAFFIYTVFIISLCSGIKLGLFQRSQMRIFSDIFVDTGASKTVRKVLYITSISIFLTMAALIISEYGLDFSKIPKIKSNFFSSSPALHFATVFGLIIYGAYFVGDTRVSTPKIALMIIVLLVMIFLGNRSRIVFALLPLLYVITAKGVRIRQFWLYPSLLLFAIAANLSLFLIRNNAGSQTLSAYIENKGGIFDSIFQTSEVSIADTFVVLIRNASTIDPNIGDSIISFAMYLIPRSLVGWKPLGGSAWFTSIYDPVGWILYDRAIVIGGFGDLYLDFGIIFGSFAAAFVGYIISRLMIRIRKRMLGQMFLLPLTMAVYAFMRNDLYAVAPIFWASICLAFFLVFVGILRNTSPVAGRIA